MKKIISSLLFISFLLVGCYKTDPAVLELLKQIQGQNDALRLQVAAMQKTTDSLAIVFKANTNAIGAMDKKIDSIRIQLSVVLIQINSLNSQLSQANANIIDIQAKLVELKSVCDKLLALLTQCCGVGSTINNGLIAYWPFNGNAQDSSGNGCNGTVNAAVLSTDRMGNINSSYSFNGSSSFIEANFTTNYSDFTLSYWLNSGPFKSYNNQIGAVVISTFSNTVTYPNNWESAFDRLIGSLAFGNALDGVRFNYITPGQWYHNLITYQASTKTVKMYANGVMKDSINTFVFNKTTNRIIFGARANTVPNCFYEGKIDDIRFYNRPLNQDEITYLATH